MIKTRYVDDTILNGLIHAIGVQAKRDYIDARQALSKGRITCHGKSAHHMMYEIEDWFRMMFDYEEAEVYIEELKKLGPEDRNSWAPIQPRNHAATPRGVSKRL